MDNEYMKCYVPGSPVVINGLHKVEVIEIKSPFNNTKLISTWAQCFRRNYISDEDLLESMNDMGIDDPFDFLKRIEYPNSKQIRSGDFGEILVAEYLTFAEHFWVPTLALRYSEKANKEESTKGSDVIAIRFEQDSTQDELCICEVKTGTSRTARERLQSAVTDSNKDDLDDFKNDKRGSIALCSVKLRLKHRHIVSEYSYQDLARFENPVENPYRIKYIAAAVVDTGKLNRKKIEKININESNHAKSLRMIVFGVLDIKKLINDLYSDLGVNELGN